jgi:ectoine hydroxylase-related dioxygenase (phytanoyl-CoA dioxygenase family)
MVTPPNPVPIRSYGILAQDDPASEQDVIADQVKRLGYAILESGYAPDELRQISDAFNSTRVNYLRKYGEARLRTVNELHTVRALLTHGDPVFSRLATNPNLLNVLGRLIIGKYILNQQNGVINPPRQTYNQGSWHRDLPYQHYVSDTPLAVNALFCVDDFTPDNGATFVLPASHRVSNFPSTKYIQRNALQVVARAGQYLILDCMLFHSGGFNHSDMERRAVNHVYSIPYFKQQIKLTELLNNVDVKSDQKELFGFGFEEPSSIEQYLSRLVR